MNNENERRERYSENVLRYCVFFFFIFGKITIFRIFLNDQFDRPRTVDLYSCIFISRIVSRAKSFAGSVFRREPDRAEFSTLEFFSLISRGSTRNCANVGTWAGWLQSRRRKFPRSGWRKSVNNA